MFSLSVLGTNIFFGVAWILVWLFLLLFWIGTAAFTYVIVSDIFCLFFHGVECKSFFDDIGFLACQGL